MNVPASRSDGASQTLQYFQGGYYILGGLWVALAIDTIQGMAIPPRPLHELWVARAIGLVVAGLGVALVLSANRQGRGSQSALGMGTAGMLIILSVASVLFSILPPTFLLDTGVEVLFLCFWVVTVLGRAEAQAERIAGPTV